MGYTFKSLCIRNFKYITNNKPLKFDFMNSNIVILDGQNGYGKTTLFDAIEVVALAEYHILSGVSRGFGAKV